MPDLRQQRLTGVFAGRRPYRPGPRRQVFCTRGQCGHLGEWDEIAPRRGDLAWCSGCGGYRVVSHVYRYSKFSGKPPCAARKISGRTELYCSEPRDHPGDHLDVALGVSWPGELQPAA